MDPVSPERLRSPRVTVILPVHNGAATIAGAINSILTQSLTDFELLVVDDGSTDGTPAILSRFNDPRLRIMTHGKNAGLSASLNEAVAAARGAYIARMDADDVAFPERLQKQADYLDLYPDIDLLATRAVVFSSPAAIAGLLPFRQSHEELTRTPWGGIPMPHPTWMGRKAWFVKHPYRLPEVKRAEDQELLIRAMDDSRYACLPDILLGYRRGAFDPGATFMARRHLLPAQVGIFLGRRQYMNALLSLLVIGAKAVIDLTAALPGRTRPLPGNRLQAKSVPAQVRATLDNLLRPAAL